MQAITATDLESKGVSILEAALKNQDEAIISVHGKPRFVVMDIAHYQRLRDVEIEAAWREAQAAVERGEFITETAQEHIERLKTELAENAL